MGGTDCTAEEMSKALEHSLGGLGNSQVNHEPYRVLVSDKVNYCICIAIVNSKSIICRVSHNSKKI